MKTWNDYKTHVKTIDTTAAAELEEMEALSAIVTAMIQQRKALGLSQRDLARLCDMPQSSVARIESGKIIPKLDTVLRLCMQLGLYLTVSRQKPVS